MNLLKDKYEIIDRIVTGEFAEVYKARHKILDRIVLLKLLHQRLVPDEEIAERFKREAKIAASIDHTHVVRVYDCGVIEKQPFIAFEWIEGEDLFQYLKRQTTGLDSEGEKKQIPLTDVLSVIASILKGLTAIHQAGVIHRDLKPENVMVDKSGVVKLTDFSLSFSGKMPRITQHGDLVGTPSYIAPEVIAGEKPTHKSDLYAVGLIAWELLTGNNPFECQDIFQTLQRVQESKLPDIENSRPGLPPDFIKLLKNLLNRYPEERIDSAREALEILIELPAYPKSGAQRSHSGIRIPSLPKVRRKTDYYSKIPVAAFFILIITALGVAGWFWSRQGTSDLPQNTRSASPVDSLSHSYDESGIEADTVSQKLPDSANELTSGETEQADRSDSEKTAGSEKTENSKPISPIPAEADLSANIQPIKEEKKQIDQEYSARPGKAGVLPEQVMEMPGYIDFSINPWARIYVDGSLKGESPLGYILKTDAGERKFLFDNPYFPLIDLVYNVPANETLKVEVNLFQHVGILSFEIQPWGHVHIDSVQVGVSPLPKPIYLKPGEHYVKVVHPNFNPFERLIKVLPGDTISLLIDLSKQGSRMKDKITEGN